MSYFVADIMLDLVLITATVLLFKQWDEAWKRNLEDKKLIYGDNRRAVGDRNPGDDGDDAADVDNDDDFEGKLEEVNDDLDDDTNTPTFDNKAGRKASEPMFLVGSSTL